MVYHEDDELRTHRTKAREAISLAMDSRWEDAAAMNREILEVSPSDLDACNRLGKALLELGDATGARGAFERSLTIDPANVIAKKNVDRLASGAAASGGGSRLAPKMFIGEAGKSAQVALLGCAANAKRPFISPGAPVELRAESGMLAVYNQDGEYIGSVPPKLGRRLVCMMEAGNRYEGAIAGSTSQAVRVLLRESFQHASQRSKISFPTSSVETPSWAAAPAPPVEHDVRLSWGDDERDDQAMAAAGASVGAMLEGGMPDDSSLPELPD
jgi:tetratricopeptide (TPR) repeat protein